MYKRSKWLLATSLVVTGLLSSAAYAADLVKPFVLADGVSGDVSSVASSVKEKLSGAGFEVVGSYSPYAGVENIVFTSSELKSTATKSERGGYGAAMRASVTKTDSGIQVTYTNPIYWANAYRLSSNLDGVTASLKSALGKQKQYGTGDKELTAEDMRGYHYTMMMEYFDDPSDLGSHGDHAAAVKAVEENLAAGKAGTSQVYKISLGKDTEGNEMTLFGVALGGTGEKDCSGDKYIMDKIDKSEVRHSAHLPYEVLVYGDEVESLFGRFRIAISWPHLPMMASETGATFMSIMCAPGSIQDALTAVGGGSSDDY
ncbi:Signal transduction histidine kinase CheA [hydrothermal vent metagenome]|uniref:Signal transduction histidine kinase CheA n=1 Tax=hydrothermal vent metagenome TaxID=652676 RepID=A0A3B0WBM9_9ZZZZ